jgi:hypothetical protein
MLAASRSLRMEAGEVLSVRSEREAAAALLSAPPSAVQYRPSLVVRQGTLQDLVTGNRGPAASASAAIQVRHSSTSRNG